MKEEIIYTDGLNNYIFVYCKLNTFFKINPPCKECLIQSMCIENEDVLLDIVLGFQIKSCSLLKEFIKKEQKKFNHI